MNQPYKIQNGNSNYENHPIIQNLTNTVNYWTSGKTKTFQAGLPKKQIRNEILKSLSVTTVEEIFPFIEQVHLNPGEYIYQPDDIINYLYFPETAIISDFQILEDGKTLEVAMIGREGIAGINSVFNSHSSPNWLQVSISGKALRIDSTIFRREFNNCEVLQNLFFDYINMYIAQISQKVICNNHHSVEERLCCWLLMISDRCELNKLPLTQEQIAGFLGVHRPSITLITQSLREKGIIDYVRGKISILDKEKLEVLSCDCYSTTKIM